MILTLDCATATGWCAGDGSTTPIVGNVNLPKGIDDPQYFDFWRRWLIQLFDDVKPTIVVFEAPFLHANMNGTTARKLIGLTAVLQEVCGHLKVPVEETTPSHVKKVLTGSGKSEKPDMLRMAKKCGVAAKTYDEADAFGIWVCAVHYHAREHQAAWDKKIYSGGALL